MELIKGRPADETGRLEKEIRVYDLLDKLGLNIYGWDLVWNVRTTSKSGLKVLFL